MSQCKVQHRNTLNLQYDYMFYHSAKENRKDYTFVLIKRIIQLIYILLSMLEAHGFCVPNIIIFSIQKQINTLVMIRIYEAPYKSRPQRSHVLGVLWETAFGFSCSILGRSCSSTSCNALEPSCSSSGLKTTTIIRYLTS